MLLHQPVLCKPEGLIAAVVVINVCVGGRGVMMEPLPLPHPGLLGEDGVPLSVHACLEVGGCMDIYMCTFTC